MRRIITMTLMFSALCGVLYTQGNKTVRPVEVKGKKGGVEILPLSEKVKDIAEKVAKSHVEIETKDLDHAREEFKGVLKKLNEVTEDYNKKAMAGAVTPEDEKAYEEVSAASLLAYNEYKKAFIKTNHSEEN